MQRFRLLPAAAIVAVAGLAACAGDPADQGLGPRCASSLSAASSALENARVSGLGGTVEWSKAAALIAAAKTQQQFSEYQNCVEKAERARVFISQIPR